MVVGEVPVSKLTLASIVVNAFSRFETRLAVREDSLSNFFRQPQKNRFALHHDPRQ